MPGCTSSWYRQGIQFNDEEKKNGSMLYLREASSKGVSNLFPTIKEVNHRPNIRILESKISEPQKQRPICWWESWMLMTELTLFLAFAWQVQSYFLWTELWCDYHPGPTKNDRCKSLVSLRRWQILKRKWPTNDKHTFKFIRSFQVSFTQW